MSDTGSLFPAPPASLAERLRGVLPPVVTPFTVAGDLDLSAFEANLEAYASRPLVGVLVLGSNGEAASLDADERLALVRAARRLTPDDRLLLVGTGLESTRHTTSLTRQVADLGADAALVLTPHYYRARMDVEALGRHFEAVADASEIPTLLYSAPQFTGIPFPVEVAARAAVHGNVVGIKESSGDVALLSRLLASVPPDFAVLCGSAPVFAAALGAGVAGGILAIACCAPEAALALYEAAASGRLDEARRLQAALMPLADAVTTRYGVAGLKLAMDLAGLRGGAVRAPLLPTPPEAEGVIRDALSRLSQALA